MVRAAKFTRFFAGFWICALSVSDPAIAQIYSVTREGAPVKVGWISDVYPDCQSKGLSTITVTNPPQHGVVKYVSGRDYTNFPTTSTYASCNRRKVQSTEVYYYPNSGFLGSDSFSIEYVFPTGFAGTRSYKVEVR